MNYKKTIENSINILENIDFEDSKNIVLLQLGAVFDLLNIIANDINETTVEEAVCKHDGEKTNLNVMGKGKRFQCHKCNLVIEEE